MVYVTDERRQPDPLHPFARPVGRNRAGNGLRTAEEPYHPFFSPDGQWVGYVTRNELKKVPITGGTPITLCEVDASRGASWGPDDTIVLAPDGSSELFTVSTAGGTPQPLTTLDEERRDFSHRWPQFTT